MLKFPRISQNFMDVSKEIPRIAVIILVFVNLKFIYLPVFVLLYSLGFYEPPKNVINIHCNARVTISQFKYVSMFVGSLDVFLMGVGEMMLYYA